MVTLAQPAYNQNAAIYLQALKSGKKPAQRLDCGRWSDLVDMVETVFEKGNGNAAFLVESLLENMIDSGKYPGLADLLSSSDAPRAGDSPPDSPALVEQNEKYPALPESAQLPADLANGASPWLDEYVKYSKLVSPEGYEDFHEACGLWLLSTIAARRIKIPFTRKQYTPLMVLLVARGGLYIKSDTALVAIDVLQAAGLRFLLGSDETTPQKLMTDMAGTLPKNYGDLDKEEQYWIERRLSMSAQRGWFYDEFGSLISAMSKEGGIMQDFKGLLLKLDKCADRYEYSTQSRGTERIDKPYLALIGCMTPPDVKQSGKSGSSFWTNGLWDRFVFICPPLNSSLDIPFKIGEIAVPYDLWKPLRNWHERLGESYISITAKYDEKDRITGYDVTRGDLPETEVTLGDGVWEAWARYRSALKKICTNLPTQDLDGSYQRLSIKAIRMAALLASLENNGIIELCHWAKAQEIAERWRKSLHELYSQVNNPELETSYAKRVEDDIIRVVKKLEAEKKPPTIRDLSRYLPKVDVGRLKQCCADLVRNNILVEDKTGRSPRYAMAIENDETTV